MCACFVCIVACVGLRIDFSLFLLPFVKKGEQHRRNNLRRDKNSSGSGGFLLKSLQLGFRSWCFLLFISPHVRRHAMRAPKMAGKQRRCAGRCSPVVVVRFLLCVYSIREICFVFFISLVSSTSGRASFYEYCGIIDC
ncbi:unnamed protein product [Hapterophycus canaliculatus]